MDLLDRLLRQELFNEVRLKMLEYIDGVETGSRYYTFNTLNVDINKTLGFVTIEDELSVDSGSTISIALDGFRKHLVT